MLVLLPLEAASGLMARTSQLLVASLSLQPGEEAPELLKVLTEPVTKLIIQVRRPAEPLRQRRLAGVRAGSWQWCSDPHVCFVISLCVRILSDIKAAF